PGGFGIASVSYTGIENVTGRNNAGFGDVLSGNADNNVINGLAGNDTLDGGGGHDTLNGGDGNDVITGGVGNDILDGGNNDDSFFFVGAISFAAASGFDTIHNFVLASGDVINLQDLSATGSWSVAEIGADSLFSFFDADVNVFANTAQVLVTGVTGLVQGTDFNII
ncbi:MAG: calcium-binding protein, partial [Hyphomicrobium sp.]